MAEREDEIIISRDSMRTVAVTEQRKPGFFMTMYLPAGREAEGNELYVQVGTFKGAARYILIKAGEGVSLKDFMWKDPGLLGSFGNFLPGQMPTLNQMRVAFKEDRLYKGILAEPNGRAGSRVTSDSKPDGLWTPADVAFGSKWIPEKVTL